MDGRKIKIAHDVDDITEGQQVVLTIRDAPLIEGGSLQDTDDVLENKPMIDDYRREYVKKIQEKLNVACCKHRAPSIPRTSSSRARSSPNMTSSTLKRMGSILITILR